MATLSTAIGLVGYQFLRFLNPRQAYYWLYLGGGLLFALCVFLWRRRARSRIRARAFLRLFGTRALWLHRSSLLDIKLYFMHGMLMLIAYSMFEISSEAWRAATDSALNALAGPGPHLHAHTWAVGAITTVSQLLALELGYWALHFAFHKVPALWEIHKVHHSAEVMTPFSEWRQHPIEFVAFANVLILANGGVYGAMAWLFGPAVQPFTLFEMNVLFVLHFATFHHLRHSGIWIAATGWLGHLFHSPAHHQIHHSADAQHFDRNLGYALSIWDWAFGTLYVPERYIKVKFGVAGVRPYQGVMDTLIRPLASVAYRLRSVSLISSGRP
jgi:sterol desaturase/sphingolipid hydroxylase (fatty acid hydroxylase superfamily)